MPYQTSPRRVLARFVKAQTDALAASLATYQDKLRDFTRLEEKAKGYAAFLATAEGLSLDEIWKTAPHNGPDGTGEIERLLYRNYAPLYQAGQQFCLTALQQVTLTPKLRKGIEGAAKFFDKRPKIPRNIPAGFDLKYVEAYLDLVKTLRKYDVVFTAAVKEGKQHSGEGTEATKVQAGPFTVVNTGGFPTAVLLEKSKVCEEAAERMTRIGLGKLCYGEVLLTNRLVSNENNAAFYVGSRDEMFVRADANIDQHTVRHVCHELAHRYVRKFMSGSHRMGDLYETLIGYTTMPSSKPKVGDTFSYSDHWFTIVEMDSSRVVVLNQKAQKNFEFPPRKFKEILEQMDPTGYRFVSAYAKKGGPEENFCEMVSFYAMGKLPPEQIELLTPLL